jgi:hypothetical protein
LLLRVYGLRCSARREQWRKSVLPKLTPAQLTREHLLTLLGHVPRALHHRLLADPQEAERAQTPHDRGHLLVGLRAVVAGVQVVPALAAVDVASLRVTQDRAKETL